MTVKLDIYDNIVSWKLPRIEIKPVVRNFDLVSIDYLLLEDAVPVPKTVAPSWEVHSSHAIQETGGEASQTTIPQCRIVFLGYDIFNAETKLTQTS